MEAEALAIVRETDDKGCALSLLSFEMNGSPVFVDDHGARDGQSLSGSFTDFFGGEERIEDSGLYASPGFQGPYPEFGPRPTPGNAGFAL